MGVFFDQVEVINRTNDETLEILYDGQRTFIEPSYDTNGKLIKDLHQFLPRVCIMHALNQTVIPGTEHVRKPGQFESYLGIVDKKDRKQRPWHDVSFIKDKPTEITRVKMEDIKDELINDATVKVVVKGKKQRDEDVGPVHRQAFDVVAN